MRDLKAVGAERGSGRLQRPPRPARPPGARGRGPGREAGDGRQPPGVRGSRAAGTFRPGALASAQVQTLQSRLPGSRPQRSSAPVPEAAARAAGTRERPRRGSSASLPRRRSGAERPARPAPRAPHLGGHGGRFPGPAGPAGLPRRGASFGPRRAARTAAAAAVAGGCGPARRRGGSVSALLSALGPPRLGASRRRPRLQFLKVPGCAAPAPAGQASHGPRRARRGRRKRAWGLGRSPASTPAPASAPTPPPAGPCVRGPRPERRPRGRASARVAAWSEPSGSRVAACGWRTTTALATRLGSPGHGGAAEGSGCLGVDYRGCHIDSQPGPSNGFLLPAWEILPSPWSFLKAVIWPGRLSGPGRLGTPF